MARAGVPEHPRAWLVQTARHIAIDRLRRRQVLRVKLEAYSDGFDAASVELAEPTEIRHVQRVINGAP